MMTRKALGLVTALWFLTTATALAQATGTPSFNAPYRAFSKSEFGATISFPTDRDFALEGQYRFGYENFDLGLRAGLMQPQGGANAVFVIGGEGRTRVITHTEDFPLDGALIVGVGGQFVSGNSLALIPIGLSLGRRIDPPDTQVSIIPYVQPTLFIRSGGGLGTDALFGFGLGGDFRLSKVFDARVSVGLGDRFVEGIAFSAVWVH
jgi:hypothetical protein